MYRGITNHHSFTICYHTILAFHLYLADKTKPTVIDLIIAANGTSLGIVAFLQENYNGVAAAIAYMFTHFFLREGYFDNDALSITDIRNYGLSSFCLLALNTLKTKKGTCKVFLNRKDIKLLMYFLNERYHFEI